MKSHWTDTCRRKGPIMGIIGIPFPSLFTPMLPFLSPTILTVFVTPEVMQRVSRLRYDIGTVIIIGFPVSRIDIRKSHFSGCRLFIWHHSSLGNIKRHCFIHDFKYWRRCNRQICFGMLVCVLFLKEEARSMFHSWPSYPAPFWSTDTISTICEMLILFNICRVFRNPIFYWNGRGKCRGKASRDRRLYLWYDGTIDYFQIWFVIFIIFNVCNCHFRAICFRFVGCTCYML